jgi:hypothetical protein
MRPMVPAAAFAIVLASVSGAFARDPQVAPQDPQFAEVAFRAAVSAWAYNEYWSLYGMGTRDSRAVLSEKDFVLQMEQGARRPGIGLEIVDVHIRGVHAVIRAKVRMEYGRCPGERFGNRPPPTGPTDEVVQSVLVYEDGAWRINLYQFVGMARY